MGKIRHLFRPESRFLRSAHLERDFRDPDALRGYIVTPEIQGSLDRLSSGLAPRSGQRAWRITGDYGSGKSSFALLLAHAFAGKESNLPPQIRRSIDLSSIRANKVSLLPILVTGSHQPLATAVIKGLATRLHELSDKRHPLKCLGRIDTAIARGQRITDDQVLTLISEANSELIARHLASGLLILIDELGKFLEFSALHPERQDIFFLQQLAEKSARSGKDLCFIVGLLHQGFQAYADHLSQSAQREWEKVAGRFEEILFDQPLEQIVHLIGASLNISTEAYPRGWSSIAHRAMRAAIDNGWYGSAPPISSLTQAAPSLYPIHPTVIPVLVKLFSRFGQNERSLFSFLLSSEPYGLQHFAESPVAAENVYRIHHLYDYAAATFGHRLSTQGYRSHWNHIDSLVRSYPASSEMELAALKTVGLLNLLNAVDLIPSERAVAAAIADSDASTHAVEKAIHKLHKQKHVLYNRGRSGGYCLWSHTSINLDAVYAEATRAVGAPRRATALVKERLDLRPIVARRHYIQTGNLRHFELAYCSVLELEQTSVAPLVKSDGRIIVPLCETAEELSLAMQFAQQFQNRADTIIGITEPLASLRGLISEAERWDWIQKNTGELKDDRYAAEEVGRQVALATRTLEKVIQHYVGLKQSAQPKETMPLKWFYRGERLRIRSASELLAWLSKLCDQLYKNAPRVHNELVNRRRLSPTAASARGRLLARMINEADKPFLGMLRAKKPPEMSMYLSVLAESGIHRKKNGQWGLLHPTSEHDSCHLSPVFGRIMDILRAKRDERVTVESIFEELRQPPFGVRDGLLPILVTVLLVEHQVDIAVYENGTFISKLGAEEIFRLAKRPLSFELQLFQLTAARLKLFDKLVDILRFGNARHSQSRLLDVVRPLCLFVAELPDYVRGTDDLTVVSKNVRDAILSAREPGTLVFTTLPAACGFEPFKAGSKTEEAEAKAYAQALKSSLDELRTAFPRLRDRIRATIAAAFEHRGAIDHSFRQSLTTRARNIVVGIREPDLKAFCLRLVDENLPDPDWIDSIASYVASSPPMRWRSGTEEVFKEKLGALVERFRRVEAMAFRHGGESQSESLFRVTLTARDGQERDRVVIATADDIQSGNQLVAKLARVLNEDPHASLYALSRLTWEALENKNGN